MLEYNVLGPDYLLRHPVRWIAHTAWFQVKIIAVSIPIMLALMFVMSQVHAGWFGGGATWIKSMERDLGKRTGRNSCGRFVQRHVPGNWSALAIDNRNRGKPSTCRPGAVAVMHGHVGVIHKAGCKGGRCSVISGNGPGGRADIKSYPQSRIVACRWPR